MAHKEGLINIVTRPEGSPKEPGVCQRCGELASDTIELVTVLPLGRKSSRRVCPTCYGGVAPSQP